MSRGYRGRWAVRARLAVVLAVLAPAVVADGGWFIASDLQMRNDLLLLNDAQVIRLPVGQWPVPRAAVRHALDNGKSFLATNAAVLAALERVRARLDADNGRGKLALDGSVAIGEEALLRSFSTLARDDGDARLHAAYETDRFSIGIGVSAAFGAQDGQDVRLDGSHATIGVGNWLISAQSLERWWGPGREGSLILSNNARPMPSLVVERATARPFGSRWLRWLGPWRFNFAVGQMEDDRRDIDSPLFMAWRVAVMPFNDIELGFSRTAQFCGEGLVCDLDSFFNMLAGNDNVGFDADPASEPGNQMAGFDIRWHSPIGSGPYAIYGQAIGEDESGYLPAKYLMQFGLEVWKPNADGGIVQGFLEYSDTTCSATSGSGPYFNCAYNQGLFDQEGYRYRGRVIGHTSDRDSRSIAFGATYTPASSGLWHATFRASELNRDRNPDPTHSLTPVPADYRALELGWRGTMSGGQLDLTVGVESFESSGLDREVEPFGFLRWSQKLLP